MPLRTDGAHHGNNPGYGRPGVRGVVNPHSDGREQRSSYIQPNPQYRPAPGAELDDDTWVEQLRPMSRTGTIPVVRTPDPDEERGRHGKRRKPKKTVDPAKRRRRKRIRRVILALFLIFFGLVGYSMYPALTAPGTDSISARLAEWARDHHLSPLVTFLENQQYNAHKPKTGGTLSQAQLQQLATPAKQGPPQVGMLPALTPIAVGAVPNEGVWRALEIVKGMPVIQAAYLRPDTIHTSYLAGVAWISQKYTKFVLHPGTQEPGHGPWSQPPSLPQNLRTGLLATFNGAFKMADSHGGYLADGRTVGTLVDGAASEIFHADGSLDIGMWGRDATLGPNVVAVRQNLQLLVDNGQVIPDLDKKNWGVTVHNAYYVPRSGIGVTAHGDIVYVTGTALSVSTLAALLQHAGAVRAMELDINADWVSFMTYNAAQDPANPVPVKLTAFTRPADRYYQISSRDFVAVYAR